MYRTRATSLLHLALFACGTLLVTSAAAAYEIDFVGSHWTDGPPIKIVLKLTGWTDGDRPYVCVKRNGEFIGIKIDYEPQPGGNITVEFEGDWKAGDSVTIENAILGGEAKFAKLGGDKSAGGGSRAEWPLVPCPEGECSPCNFPIPTVSEWGLIVMTLVLLTAGTVVFGRRRRHAAV